MTEVTLTPDQAAALQEQVLWKYGSLAQAVHHAADHASSNATSEAFDDLAAAQTALMPWATLLDELGLAPAGERSGESVITTANDAMLSEILDEAIDLSADRCGEKCNRDKLCAEVKRLNSLLHLAERAC